MRCFVFPGLLPAYSVMQDLKVKASPTINNGFEQSSKQTSRKGKEIVNAS